MQLPSPTCSWFIFIDCCHQVFWGNQELPNISQSSFSTSPTLPKTGHLNIQRFCIAINHASLQLLTLSLKRNSMECLHSICLHSICFRELPRNKSYKKPSASFRDCSPVPFSKSYDTILHIMLSKINDAAHMCQGRSTPITSI